MKVIVSHRASEVRNVCSGVPQGSVLDPLLFIFYVNFLTNDIVSSTKIFADDLKLYNKINTANNLDHISDLHTCQTDINTLAAVSRSWRLSMNTMKCAVLRFQRNPTNWVDLATLGSYF